MVPQAAIDGFCDRRFSAVREAFAATFADGLEQGAAFAAVVGGELVVDLWGGFADAAGKRPWQENTIINVFSTTKAMTALCAHMLVDRGMLDLDLPVSHYWPEFAQAGKGDLRVRYLLSHQAGLAAVREPLPTTILFDWDAFTSVLAAEDPWWEPGTDSGYHAMTFGHLIGEVIRRVSRRSVGQFFREEVAEPLGLDFHIGLPASEDPRVAEMMAPSVRHVASSRGIKATAKDGLFAKVMSNPKISPRLANQPEWRRAEIPAANGHGNARSLARAMAVLASGGSLGGVHLLGPDTLQQAIAPQWSGRDLVLGIPLSWGLGFMLSCDAMPLGPNPRVFGHAGWGGSFAMADPDAGVAWAYVMNKMSASIAGDVRGFGLAASVYASLE